MTVRELVLMHGDQSMGGDFTFKQSETELWIFFRASMTFLDWVRDFLCITVAWLGCSRAHFGYVKEFDDAYSRLLSVLYSAIAANKRIYLIGYSKGAAVVTLLYHYVMTFYPTDNIRVVIAGCPPVFFLRKPTFPQYSNKIKHVRYGNDIVCWLPPWFIKADITLNPVSQSKWPFKCIKDHGAYVNCNDIIPQSWFA